MTQQTGVGAVLRTKAECHRCVRGIIDLVGSGLKQKAVHDAGHVAGDTATRFRLGWMECMLFSRASQLGMALQTHLIWPIKKLE